jgi:hypothetical protein
VPLVVGCLTGLSLSVIIPASATARGFTALRAHTGTSIHRFRFCLRLSGYLFGGWGIPGEGERHSGMKPNRILKPFRSTRLMRCSDGNLPGRSFLATMPPMSAEDYNRF